MQAPYAALCKGAFVMDNFELIDTMAVSWEVLLYPDQPLKAAAGRFYPRDFEILGWCPAGPVLPHGEKVPLWPWLATLLVMVSR